MAISNHRLRSGIVKGGVTDAFHQMAPSLGILILTRVFVDAFTAYNLAQKRPLVNPRFCDFSQEKFVEFWSRQEKLEFYKQKNV